MTGDLSKDYFLILGSLWHHSVKVGKIMDAWKDVRSKKRIKNEMTKGIQFEQSCTNDKC